MFNYDHVIMYRTRILRCSAEERLGESHTDATLKTTGGRGAEGGALAVYNQDNYVTSPGTGFFLYSCSIEECSAGVCSSQLCPRLLPDLQSLRSMQNIPGFINYTCYTLALAVLVVHVKLFAVSREPNAWRSA
jgi:hypothetical protein